MKVTTTNDIIKQRFLKEIADSKVKQSSIAKIVGVSKSVFSEYKTTKKMPSLETFAKICQALDLDANYILGISDI